MSSASGTFTFKAQPRRRAATPRNLAMDLNRRNLIASASAAALPARARAQSGNSNTIRIGVLSDMAGPYRDISGPGGVACVRQAIQDFGDHGFKVEVVAADHQNRPDIASNIARQWFDRDAVDCLAEVVSSAPALATALGGHRRHRGGSPGQLAPTPRSRALAAV
jgi:ABC-type branched-subunit amino acid transport system substrate-binding protein